MATIALEDGYGGRMELFDSSILKTDGAAHQIAVAGKPWMTKWVHVDDYNAAMRKVSGSLYDQMCPVTLRGVAALCNTTTDNAAFTNALRSIDAISPGFTVGDASIAYLEHLLTKFRKFKDERKNAGD